MKKSALMFLLMGSVIYSQTQYQDGFNEGFKNGYCYGTIMGCIAPIAPIDLVMNYQTGYNNGFTAGKNLKATSSHSIDNTYSEVVAPISLVVPSINTDYIQKEWENYYEKIQAKKELKEEREHTMLVEYYKLSFKVDRLKKEYSEKGILTDILQNQIQTIQDKNNKLLKKYRKKTQKITEFIYEITKLDLELNDIIHNEIKIKGVQ